MANDSPMRGKLTADEVDDVLYLVRVNDAEELTAFLAELAQRYNAQQKEVLQACVDEDSGNTVLHYCAANGHSGLLQTILGLLQSEPPSHLLSQRNASGNTPLHWASLNGHLEATKALVKAGSDLWVRNQAGNLAVFEAERAGKDDVVAYLLLAGGTEKEMEEAGEKESESETTDAGETSAAAQSADVDSAQEKLVNTHLGE